jgi:hypothetical protein
MSKPSRDAEENEGGTAGMSNSIRPPLPET